MKFDVQIAHSVTEIGEEAWNSLSAGRPFTSYRWYRYCEAVLSDCIPVYILLSQASQTVARATFWVKRWEGMPISSRIARFFIEALLRRWPLMICHVPFANRSGLILPEHDPLRKAALKEIAKVAQHEARQYSVSFLIFDYLKDESLKDIMPLNFKPMSGLESGTQLSVRWPNFEAYVRDLGQRTKKNYHRHWREANRQGIKVQAQSSFTHRDVAMQLIRNVENRYGGLTYPWSRPLLENMDMVDSTWITVEQDGRLLGCELVLGDGDIQFVSALGLDYSVDHIYFLLGYTDIRLAIEKGIRELHWGSGVYETKQRFGFQREDPTYLAYAGQGALFNAVASGKGMYTKLDED